MGKKRKEVKAAWSLEKVRSDYAKNEAELKRLYAYMGTDEFANLKFEACQALTNEIALLQGLVKLQRIEISKHEANGKATV